MAGTAEPSFRVRLGGWYLKLSWALVVVGLLETLVAATLLLLRITDPADGDHVLVVLHLIFLFLGLGLAGTGFLNWYIYSTAETRLTEHGLINRELWSRLIPWHTIADIHVFRRGRFWRTRVELRDGRRKILVAPLTKASAPDPAFTRDVQTIHDWWQRHRLPDIGSPTGRPSARHLPIINAGRKRYVSPGPGRFSCDHPNYAKAIRPLQADTLAMKGRGAG